MKTLLNRRRFLTISAAAMAVSGSVAGASSKVVRWNGRALGAAASLQLTGISAENAGVIFARVQAELTRLEFIFSLYRHESEISRLNATGRLVAPSPEMLEVLAHCDRLNSATNGAFDPTVQPLFDAMAQAAAQSRSVSQFELDRILPALGWGGVELDTREVRLARPGAALTLNGIAQGFITDQIADRLKAEGLVNILVDMGEISALGVKPDGAEWRAGIATPQGAIVKRLNLSNRALATSASKGTVLDKHGLIGHIYDPKSGQEPQGSPLVSVSAPRAVLADGLSTALCVLPRNRHASTVRQFPGVRVELAI